MGQDEQQRVQRIKEFVLARLRGELSAAPRGAQARMAKRLGVSGAHLSNMLSPTPTRQPGEDFRRKVAAHWGMSYAQLEALATGEELPVGAAPPALSPAELVSALHDYVWAAELPTELRPVITEQSRQYFLLLGAAMSAGEWKVVLAGLEREALAFARRRALLPPPAGTSAVGDEIKDR